MDYFTANRKNWDDRVEPHLGDQGLFYKVPSFLAGQSSLKNVEIQALGNVSGKSMLHLMCHFGLDSLSWARLGAHVTGVDFSAKSIRAARKLAKQAGLEAEFIQANVYELPQKLTGSFDIVIATYGILCWLPDLSTFMAVAVQFLKSGGTFLLVDGHPLLNIMEYDETTKFFTCSDAYFHNGVPEECGVSFSYTGTNKPLQNSTTFQWNHDLGHIVNSLLKNNLYLVSLLEFPFCYYRRYSNMQQNENGYWRFPAPEPNPPMMFSIQAIKQEQ